IPFGAGTSVEGHVAAVHGGISVDLTRMDRVLSISTDDLDCRVEAGLTRNRLNEALRDRGLFFPVDPGADATIGGMVATGASGTTTVRYGAMRDNVLGLTVVLADGRTVRTGGRARKSSAGYDLTRLLIGSEGTLGIITEVGLRLYGVPESSSAAVCQYADVASAVRTVIAVVQLGIPVARCELLDDAMMAATIAYSGLAGFAVLPTLFLEFQGSAESVRASAREVAEIAGEHGGTEFRWATAAGERRALWKARHDAYFACRAMAPGKAGITTDACVPISALARCIEHTRRDVEASGLSAPLVGHVGDGNFHLIVLYDPGDAAERRRAERLNDRLVRRALAAGGTCTGEHGIGLGKRGFLAREHGAGVEVMRAIKDALDPLGLMNPGKILPDRPLR
ncbi:MAG TPA: FAD-linked oxidase C-terminal domain-containing protein, partial [Candidatus Polarisedimenticolaceae bacterium]|nr:FAD-linked oxidase C-terminal domain-containing protein [Candidatus Polarisedimenticolaceae bacterium]